MAGRVQTLVNLGAFLLQTFAVSRIFKYVGVRGALFVLPLVALGGYTAIALVPIYAIVQWTKVLENSTDYSVQNTTRQALFLPTSREAKYKAKQAIDSFFLRTGDMLSAAVVFAGTALAFTVTAVRADEHRGRRRLAGSCVRHRARAPEARACRCARQGSVDASLELPGFSEHAYRCVACVSCSSPCTIRGGGRRGAGAADARRGARS